MTRILDTSRSRFGWSREAGDWKCAQLGAYENVLHLDERLLDPEGAAPLLRGTLGHLALAHRHWRIRARQRGEDPNAVLLPEEAVTQFARANPEYLPFLDLIRDKVYPAFAKKYPAPWGDILLVEDEVVGVLGWRYASAEAPAWGLWHVRDDVGLALTGEEGAEPLPGLGESTIVPTVLDCPGAARHGKIMGLSRRWDLVFRNPRNGKVIVADYKFTSADASDARIDAYAPDGQFHANTILGRQRYGADFAGVMVCLIHVNSLRIHMGEVPVAPYRVATFPHQLHARRLLRAQREVAKMDPWLYPRADEETVCRHRYGDCRFRKLCDYGPDYLRLRGHVPRA